MSPLTAPTFKWQFLLPRYWLTWLGIILLYIISWLPLFILSGLARVVAFLLTIFAKRRVDIARQNLELTWPSMADKDREILLKKHLHRAGMAIFEKPAAQLAVVLGPSWFGNRALVATSAIG